MEAIAIIDFGSQYAHLISNRLRRLNAYAEIVLPDIELHRLKNYKGIVLSGGPQSVYEKAAPTIDPRIFSLGIPILGLCYGHQLMANLLGGKVVAGKIKEYGYAELHVIKNSGVFSGIKPFSQVWMSHGDIVKKPAPGFVITGETEDCPIAATENAARKLFSTQFHVEVTHTEEGLKILENFIKICRVKRQWNTNRFLQEKIKEIKKTVSNRKVFLLVSGGVDSTVAYALLSKAIGNERVYGLFVDTGFLRKNEAEKITLALKKIGIKNLNTIDASAKFYRSLANAIDPEEKRTLIGNLFLKIQAQVVKKLMLEPRYWMLGQGTIYPDTIESAGTRHADRIKTHHNRVPEIIEMIKAGKVIEPVSELYKDEVRELGKKLGLPDEIIWQHPFPGPGLAIRILCAKHEKTSEENDAAQKEINRYLLPHGLFGKILPIRSVGVQGDSRTYRNPLALFGKPHDFDDLESISTSLTNNFPQINRVCLLVAPKRIENVHLIPNSLTRKRLHLLQMIDNMVMRFIATHGLMGQMWQFPTVLLPLAINGKKKESIVLRPICSQEAMTAHFFKMSMPLLKKLVRKLMPHISAVFYDITNKPPGTIEWE